MTINHKTSPKDLSDNLHHIANGDVGYQSYAIIEQRKLHLAATKIMSITLTVRELVYNVLDDPTASEDLKEKARAALRSII